MVIIQVNNISDNLIFICLFRNQYMNQSAGNYTYMHGRLKNVYYIDTLLGNSLRNHNKEIFVVSFDSNYFCCCNVITIFFVLFTNPKSILKKMVCCFSVDMFC